MTWPTDDLHRIGAAEELRITPKRTGRSLPIWVVCVGEQVYVRTWYRRDTGWFAHVLAARRATIDVPGLHADVEVEDVGAEPSSLRERIDAAYRTKYQGYASMVTLEAAATTLRLSPDSQDRRSPA